MTGACGFLGQHTAIYLGQQGHSVYGIGRKSCSSHEVEQLGLEDWIGDEISLPFLREKGLDFDCIVHCAGSSSVALSLDRPKNDFENTVSTTLEILEFIRLHSPQTKLIYPSSAAVYGEHDDSRISINEPLVPASPYGVHKKIVEELCLSYNRYFGVPLSIIRFFSIYGPGLEKQLIWDACNKMIGSPEQVSFSGTGKETRDWIYISDAVELIDSCLDVPGCPLVLNGGGGVGIAIEQTLVTLARKLNLEGIHIEFDGAVRLGDPCHYEADLRECARLNWKPRISLEDGLGKYVAWFRALGDD